MRLCSREWSVAIELFGIGQLRPDEIVNEQLVLSSCDRAVEMEQVRLCAAESGQLRLDSYD